MPMGEAFIRVFAQIPGCFSGTAAHNRIIELEGANYLIQPLPNAGTA